MLLVARAGESAQGTFTVGTAAFAHKDNLNTNDYAIMQSDGTQKDTHLNSGGELDLE